MTDLTSNATAKLSRLASSFGVARLVAGGLVLIYLLSDCFFIVQPTEMAGVRRLGTVASHEPFEPGFHFKAPVHRQGGQAAGVHRHVPHR